MVHFPTSSDISRVVQLSKGLKIEVEFENESCCKSHALLTAIFPSPNYFPLWTIAHHRAARIDRHRPAIYFPPPDAH
jgi:hypothetical protein